MHSSLLMPDPGAFNRGCPQSLRPDPGSPMVHAGGSDDDAGLDLILLIAARATSAELESSVYLLWLVQETSETLDGAVHGLIDNRQGGVVPKKGTVVLVSGLSADPQKDMDTCAGHKCPMAVRGTNHHVVVLCQLSSWKLHPGQQLMDANKRSVMAMGVYAQFMKLHLAWLQVLDGTSFWCSKCGDCMMGVVWRTMVCCWCVTVRDVDEHIV